MITLHTNHLFFIVWKVFFCGSDISIEALYIYVCMPIFIYIFKEIQVCTDVGLSVQTGHCLLLRRNSYKVNGIMSVSSVESLAFFSLTRKIIDFYFVIFKQN